MGITAYEDTFKSKNTYENILTGINKEETEYRPEGRRKLNENGSLRKLLSSITVWWWAVIIIAHFGLNCSITQRYPFEDVHAQPFLEPPDAF